MVAAHASHSNAICMRCLVHKKTTKICMAVTTEVTWLGLKQLSMRAVFIHFININYTYYFVGVLCFDMASKTTKPNKSNIGYTYLLPNFIYLTSYIYITNMSF